jgi:Arc/MetJ family transcription regulator
MRNLLVLRPGGYVDMGTHMKTTIEISDPLLTAARRAAARDGQTLRDVVEAALRQWLATRKAARQPFVLEDASIAGKGLRDGLSYDDWGKILDVAYGDRG